jgi:hypothetical protein
VQFNLPACRKPFAAKFNPPQKGRRLRGVPFFAPKAASPACRAEIFWHRNVSKVFSRRTAYNSSIEKSKLKNHFFVAFGCSVVIFV